MCAVSMPGDFFIDRYKKQPWFPQQPLDPQTNPFRNILNNSAWVSRSEFDALKKEVELMKELLIKSKEYDKKNNEPNCEIDSKMALLKKIAEALDVDLSEVLKKE